MHSRAMDTARQLDEANTWGLRFTNADAIGHVTGALLDGFRGKPGQLPLVVTPNVDILITLEDASNRVLDTVEKAAIVLPDGQPLVSFSHLAGDRLRAKLAGSDLTAELWPALVAEDRSTFAIVSDAQVGMALAEQHIGFDWVEAPILPAEDGSLIDRFAWECIERIGQMSTAPEFVFGARC